MQVVAIALLMTLTPIPWAAAQVAELPPGGTFWDDDGTTHEASIEAIVAEGITNGCSADGRNFCPGQAVTRGQMATFLSRALALPPADRDYFEDVRGSTHEDNINRVAAVGIAEGRGDGTFGADVDVTREQMATFLARGFDLPPYPYDWFRDISGVHYENIKAVAAADISQGCTFDGASFCPTDPVTRGQMATFLTRALGLSPLRPPPRLSEPEPGIAECATSRSQPENVARCLIAAATADDYETVATVATPAVVNELRELRQYGPHDFGSFDGCGEPLLTEPSTGLSCYFFVIPDPQYHGVTTEMGMGIRGNEYFVEVLQFIG